MDIKEAIKYLKKQKITVKKDVLGYSITNAQNFTLKVNEKAIINYAERLKNPPKVTSLVSEITKMFWA